MTFNESNTVEAYLRDLLCGGVTHHTAAGPGLARRSGQISGAGWHYHAASDIPRQPHDVFVESYVREALNRLNPEIAANPDRADEVIYKLRAIVLSVRSDGLIKANEEFTAWFRGERSMPFGPNHEHRTVRLFDFEDVGQNHYIVTQQLVFRAGAIKRIPDLVLFVNGFPLVIIEAKTPVRPAISWVDGAKDIHEDYERHTPELFACNVLNVASEGKELRYGSIRMPIRLWGPWRADGDDAPSGLADIKKAVSGLLSPSTLLDILSSFTLFATDKKKRRFKIVSRYQQYEGANAIVDRVVAGYPKKGLLWHFQGSGKSLLMVFAAQKLRMHARLQNPTVLIVVDRVDLDAQISATFHAADIPNLVKARSRRDLKRMLRQDARKILITTIFKFGEETPLQKADRVLRLSRKRLRAGRHDEAWLHVAEVEDVLPEIEAEQRPKIQKRLAKAIAALDEAGIARPGGLAALVASAKEDDTGVLNERGNIIVLVDEAHRTQEGDLGIQMRQALPNAFLFGLTGTPIDKVSRNTFRTFGADEDDRGYLSRYSFEESIRDGATLRLHFDPRMIDLHIDKEAIEEAYAELTGGLSDLEKDALAKKASRMSVLVKAPERLTAICQDIAHHYQDKVEPNGFNGMVVTFDQETCLLYKRELDRYLDPDASDVVISVSGKEKNDKAYAKYKRDRDQEEALLDRYRDPNDPLKILIVTAKLLTGFDAPSLQVMYLDKPMRDHTLLQAICRTNRTYTAPSGSDKTHGLIVDYLGVFDDVAKALAFDEKGFKKVVGNIGKLAKDLAAAVQKCLAFFTGVDRTVGGYEGLIAAQECLPTNEVRDAFAAEFSYLSKLWEALSPDPQLAAHKKDYKWLSQVYESVKPSTGAGALLWHALGAKTIELIHENVHVDAIHDDLDELVVDADLLEAIVSAADPKKTKEIEIKVSVRLRKHLGNPRFKPISERLEKLKERHDAGQLNSLEFLKALLDIARDVVAAEKDVPQQVDEDIGKSALTELFKEVKNADTPVMVERVVNDIDDIVRAVRFPGWQHTTAGEREVKKALRGTLFKYKLHRDSELFEKAYGYIVQYY